MKKLKKMLASILVVGTIVASLAVPAFALSHHFPGPYSFDNNWQSPTEDYNGHMIRCVFYPTCPLDADVQVELHRTWTIGPVPETQVRWTNDGEERTWWNSETGRYYVRMKALNNEYNDKSRADITIRNIWIENFSGNVDTGPTV